MKMRIGLAAAFLTTACTHTPDPPEQVYICEATFNGDAGQFTAVKYLDLDGTLRHWTTSENSELRWVLNAEDGSGLATLLSQPWEPDAYKHDGKVSLRIYWSDPLPGGTRVFLDIPGQGLAFEGLPIGEKSASSSIYTDWPPFKSAIQGRSTADIVFTNPTGDIIRRNPTSLETFHKAEAKLQELKADVDQMSKNYETACRKETFEYIIIT